MSKAEGKRTDWSRLPLWPTLIVLLAVGAMIALGFWQLERKSEKEALIALYERNSQLHEPVTFPQMPPVEDDFLYRKSSVMCLEPVRWEARSGKDRSDAAGIRHIADCRTGAEGPGALIALGVSDDVAPPEWKGGLVHGTIVPGPDQPGLFRQLTGGGAPVRPMLIADTPVAPLRPSAVPSASAIPNNHAAYAGQWFFFAVSALLIYILAVRRRLRP